MSAEPRLGFTLWDELEFDSDVPNNDNLFRLSAFLALRVQSATTTAEPAIVSGTDDGKVWILPTGRTGTNWAGQAVGTIAVAYLGLWYFYTPKGYIVAHANDTGYLHYWTGSAWAYNDVLFGSKGTDIASAATTNLASATGIYVHITGTTTITALGTAKAGTLRWARFAGALTLTHNATSLILPTGANIVTAANDTALFVSEGSGNWRCVQYTRADGTALALAASAMEYKGAWNASTNTPTLINGTGNSGDIYRVSVAGTRNLGAGSVDYAVGDLVIYNATTLVWDHAPAANDNPNFFHPVVTDLGNVSGAVTIDLSLGQRFRMTLTGNVTSMAFSNLPAAGRFADIVLEIVQDGTGGRTVAWPVSGKWPNGIAHVVSSAAGDEDHVGMCVKNAGTWAGYPVEDMA